MVDFLRIGSGKLEVEISPFGASLARVWHTSHETSLVLGLATAEDYLNADHAIGVVVGPVAGRISEARTYIDGRTYNLSRNAGPHCLHSGPTGLQHRHWQTSDQSTTSLTLECELRNGECGLPGNRHFRVHYTISEADLEIKIEATTNSETIVNCASHAYWNLDATGDLSNHLLCVKAAEMCETNEQLVPTGRIVDVSSGPFDFTTPANPLSGPALDGCFCMPVVPQRTLHSAMTLASRQSGIQMEVTTNQPGLVLYTAEHMPKLKAPPKTPRIAPFSAIAIEAQGWPDANNHNNFPSIVLKPGTVLRQVTRFSLQMP